MPKVSVIIPVYNVERYLGECLDSILGQTLKDIEVLCVDDGSTDSSPRILADYAAKDPRVKVLHAEHGGAYRARAVGLAASCGDYVHFMDADDILAREAYARLVGLADREGLDHVIFSASVFTDGCADARIFREMKRRFERRYELSDDVIGRAMPGPDLMTSLLDADRFFVSPPMRILRGDLLRNRTWHMPRATSRADNYFTPLSLLLSRRACAVSDRYYRRRVRPGSISTAAGSEARHFRNLLEVLSLYCSLPEFADTIGDPSSPIARYAAIVVRNLGPWMAALSPEERYRIANEVFADASPALRMMVCSGVLPLLSRLDAAGRKSRHGLFRRILGRVRRLLGRFA